MTNERVIQRREQDRLRRRDWISRMTKVQLAEYRERCRLRERKRRQREREKRYVQFLEQRQKDQECKKRSKETVAEVQEEHESQDRAEKHEQLNKIRKQDVNHQGVRLSRMTEAQLAECKERRRQRMNRRRQQERNINHVQSGVPPEDQQAQHEQPHDKGKNSQMVEVSSRGYLETSVHLSKAQGQNSTNDIPNDQSKDQDKICQGTRSSRMTEAQLAECRERRRQRFIRRRQQERERRLIQSRVGCQQLQEAEDNNHDKDNH